MKNLIYSCSWACIQYIALRWTHFCPTIAQQGTRGTNTTINSKVCLWRCWDEEGWFPADTVFLWAPHLCIKTGYCNPSLKECLSRGLNHHKLMLKHNPAAPDSIRCLRETVSLRPCQEHVSSDFHWAKPGKLWYFSDFYLPSCPVIVSDYI